VGGEECVEGIGGGAGIGNWSEEGARKDGSRFVTGAS